MLSFVNSSLADSTAQKGGELSCGEIVALGTNAWKHWGYYIATGFLSLHGSSRFESGGPCQGAAKASFSTREGELGAKCNSKVRGSSDLTNKEPGCCGVSQGQDWIQRQWSGSGTVRGHSASWVTGGQALASCFLHNSSYQQRS